MVERKLFQPELFDEKRIAEAIDPEDPTLRYCLCRSRETAIRNRLLELTHGALDKIAASPRRSSAETIGARVGKVLAKFKCGKFVEWETVNGKLRWTFKQEKIDAEKRLDGCYIVCARRVSKETMATNEVVSSYRKLELVESAFRNLKTVQLEVRPIDHKKDDRIRAHVFLCTLAYYVQWHMIQCLQPLFAKDGEGKNRQWSFKNVMERLKCIRRENFRLGGVEFQTVGTAEADQKEILELLGIKLKGL